MLLLFSLELCNDKHMFGLGEQLLWNELVGSEFVYANTIKVLSADLFQD